MILSLSNIVIALGLIGRTLSAPASISNISLSKRAFSCSPLVQGLTSADCQHMSNIGMAGQGQNAQNPNGGIWQGTEGPNVFTFQNSAGTGIILIIWSVQGSADYEASFMNARPPQISLSIANGQSVSISIANSVSGGWAGLYDDQTTLSEWGQINNTWGEFTTGSSATVDVSREINMSGHPMHIELDSGCISDLETCVFQCKDGSNTCWEAGTYELANCVPAEEGGQPGAANGSNYGQPSGGCQGFENGGHINVTFSSLGG